MHLMPLNFLSENPMKSIDIYMIFILKSNMGWKESLYKANIEEMCAIEHKVNDMHKEILKDMQIINPIGIFHFDDESTNSEMLIKSFQDTMFKIRDSESPTP